MPKVHQLSRQQARQVAVKAQLLDRDRPAGLLSVVRRLTLLQLDPVSAVAPSADLVAWSRLGPAYSPADLRKALEDRELIELQAYVRPADPAGPTTRTSPGCSSSWWLAARSRSPHSRHDRRDRPGNRRARDLARARPRGPQAGLTLAAPPPGVPAAVASILLDVIS